MHPLISTLTRKYSELWFSFYDERPGKLFHGVDQQLCIQIARNSRDTKGVNVTSMRHWSTALQDERPALFDTTSYCAISPDKKYAEVFPKINLEVENNILSKIYQIKKKSIYYIQGTAPFGHLYYRNAGGRYWRLVKSTPSYFKSGKGKNSSTTELEMKVNKLSIPILVSLFSSNLFYWYWRVVSNCRHLTNRELNDFPISESLFIEPVYSEIVALCTEYEKNIEQTSKIKITQNKSSGQIEQAEYYVNLSKSIIDDIDRLLAKHYGFTDKELDFIINYDIKYRMGKGTSDDEDAE